MWKNGEPNKHQSPSPNDSLPESSENTDELKLRMVIRNHKEWPKPSSKIPDNDDNFRLFKEEVTISLIIGITLESIKLFIVSLEFKLLRLSSVSEKVINPIKILFKNY